MYGGFAEPLLPEGGMGLVALLWLGEQWVTMSNLRSACGGSPSSSCCWEKPAKGCPCSRAECDERPS